MSHRPDPAADFITRQPEMVRAYRQRLVSDRSSFGVDAKHWSHSRRFARDIFAECVFSLRYGRLSALSAAVLDIQPETTGSDDRDHAAIQCIHAARTLFRVTSETLCELFEDREDSERLAQVLTDLHTAIHRGLEQPAVAVESIRQSERDMSREIHDHIGNSASLALRQLELFEVTRRRGADEDEQAERLESLKRTLIETVLSTRELVTGLRSGSQEPHGLRSSLVDFLAAAKVTHPVVHLDIRDDENCVAAGLGDALFVMVRECLRNTLSHAHASVVSVDVGVEEGRSLVARVQDDGVGFAPHTRHGNGLRALYERAELLGGSVTVNSAPERGTEVVITIPFGGGVRGSAGP